MSRLDWKRGRFTINYEQNEMNSGMRARQDEVGDKVDWYRFDSMTSVENNIYDEGSGVGRIYRGPFPVPVIHVVREEGLNENLPQGLYFNDSIHVSASYDQLSRTGLTDMDIKTDGYLQDRLVYDDRVFGIMKIEVLGQIQERDVVVSIEALQVKPDQLVGDVQFARWSL